MSAPPVDASGDPGEAVLVEWLRHSSAYVSDYALVAFGNDAVVGHVMATWGDVDGAPLLGVGPLSVAPNVQGCGAGSALMNALLERMRANGEAGAVLLGDPAYYGRFGFSPAATRGIVADPSWGDYFQAIELTPGRLPAGAYSYAEPFSRLG